MPRGKRKTDKKRFHIYNRGYFKHFSIDQTHHNLAFNINIQDTSKVFHLFYFSPSGVLSASGVDSGVLVAVLVVLKFHSDVAIGSLVSAVDEVLVVDIII